MAQSWRTCQQEQVACAGCGKMDSCTVSPEHSAFKCWRQDGKVIRVNEGQTLSVQHGGFSSIQEAAEVLSRKLGRFTGSWRYHDREGKEVMLVMRFDEAGRKQYRPLRPEAGAWKVGDPEGLLPLYRLPEVVKAQRVYVCEGEKAADAGKRINILCTTSAHGASSAAKSDWSVLAGKEVIIMPDHDEPGTKYAQSVARLLLSLPTPPVVKIMELPGLKEGEDLYDWVGMMGTQHSAEELHSVIEEAASKLPPISPDALAPAEQKVDELELGPIVTDIADVKPEPIQWLWEGKLALGKLSGWAGAPGDGKSIASMDVAARVTTGTDWPDGGKSIKGSVLLITAEDGLSDTIRPRLDAHGADVRKVKHFSSVRRQRNGQVYQQLFNLANLKELEKTLTGIEDCKLVIIDPVGSFFGTDVDSNGDAAVRSVLAPIATLAEQRGVAVLLIMHTRKEGGDRADDAVMGSRAFTGIVRCMWHVRRDPDDPERRLLLPGKNNTSRALTGLAYRVIDANGVGKVQWEDKPVEMTADQALQKARASDAIETMSQREEIQNWIEQQLQGGPKPAGSDKNPEPQPGTILQDARDAGYYWRSVQRVAARMSIIRAKKGSTTVWLLPSTP